MADPVGVDTPQSNTYSRIIEGSSVAANMPSPYHVLNVAPHTPPITWFEFDPPVQSVEFSYSRLLNQGAIWSGQIVAADSMAVLAMSRPSGDLFYTVHDRKTLYSNVPSATLPWNNWTQVKLQASGDRIQWLEFRGQLLMDDLEVTRRPLACTSSVVRGAEVTCELTSASLSVTGWEFEPDSLPGIPRLPGVQDTATTKIWRGIAAVGGTATVHATDGANQRTLRTHFLVTNRPSPWPSMQTYRVGPELTAPDAEPGLNVVLGQNCPEISGSPTCLPTRRVQPDPANHPGEGNTVARIESGPNKGYWYVQSATYHMKRVGNVNPGILPTSARTHQLPANVPKKCRQGLGFGPKDIVVANFNRYNDKCQRINMTLFVDAVYGHEGFGYGGGQGHESLARTAAAEPKNDPYLAIETLVSTESTAMKDEADRRIARIGQDILNRSKDPLPSGNYAAGPIWFWDAGAMLFLQYPINAF
jgi:hypothetical protein